MTKYKLVPVDEVNNVWMLKRKVWWIFYSFVGVGSKAKLEAFMRDNP